MNFVFIFDFPIFCNCIIITTKKGKQGKPQITLDISTSHSSRATKDYDFILFDSPPIVNVTDAVLISRNMDQIIMVVRSGVSTYDSITKAYKMIKNSNANVLGQIINAVDEKKYNYAYQKYYSSYGYYKDEV